MLKIFKHHFNKKNITFKNILYFCAILIVIIPNKNHGSLAPSSLSQHHDTIWRIQNNLRETHNLLHGMLAINESNRRLQSYLSSLESILPREKENQQLLSELAIKADSNKDLREFIDWAQNMRDHQLRFINNICKPYIA